MIVGIGTDLVHIPRIQTLLDKHGDKIAARILSDSEFDAFQHVKNQAGFLAKRFAAKEAVSKALGTGFSSGITWKDIELTHLDTGQPIIILHAKAQDVASSLGTQSVHISLSDEAGLVSAFAVLS